VTISEFTADGIVSWEIRRDEAGTPRARYWPTAPWTDLSEAGILSEREVSRIAWPQDGSVAVLVCSAVNDPYASQAFDIVVDAHQAVQAYRYNGSLDELLLEVIAAEPLTQWYELVTLRRTQTGRLVLTGTQLFPPGARRGERQSLTVRCEPSGENGTVFAVVATESVDQVRLVSLESVNLAPGVYNLTAVLRGPGVVHFEGLPTKLREEHRSWPEIVMSVPARLDFSQPAHLICTIEVSGDPAVVADRIEQAEQLIRQVSMAAEDRLRISLISYGPHPMGRAFAGEPARVLIWAQARAAALAELDRLKRRKAAETGYPRAAQIECMLALVARELGRPDQDNGRPVLVTVGSRPPFPARLDPATEIIPCPEQNDWRRSLRQMQDEHPGIAFGAINDSHPDQEIWHHLGISAFAAANSNIFDVQGFAERLGLLSRVEYIPFPLIEAEGN
jgi:hypothetical protein